MSRPWRIEYEGALYHVLSRGNNRCDIFLDGKDRLDFLDVLGEMSERFEVDVFAFTLMKNHYHLLLKTRHRNLSKSMQWLGVTYSRRFNNRHRRSGHLFQGRFKSILVQNDNYMLRLSLYIHRNPLRAGLVNRLADYQWSSYRYYAYGIKQPEWLNAETILNQLKNTADPHKAYRESAQKYAHEEPSLWEDLKHGFILGGRQFAAEIKRQHLPEKPHREIPQQRKLREDIDVDGVAIKIAKALGIDIDSYRRRPRLYGEEALKRDLLMYILWLHGHWSNQKIGALFDLSYSSVSRRVALLKQRLVEDDDLNQIVKRLKSQIKM